MARGGAREGAGRIPLPEEIKRKQRGIWLTDDEWDYIEKHFSELGKSKSEKIRNIVIEKINKDKGVWKNTLFLWKIVVDNSKIKRYI